MTIAEKITRAKEDYDAVYEAGEQVGYEKGHDAGYKEGEEAGLNAGGYNDGYSDGFTDGKQAEYNAFWDAVQQNGNRTDYSRAFMRWGSEYIRPKHKVVPTVKGGAYNTIYNCPNLKKIEAAYFDFSQLPYGTGGTETHSYGFGLCPQLEEVEDVGLYPSYSYSYAFISCYALRKVACIRVDMNTSLSNIFQGCTNLEEVKFEGEIGQDLKLNVCTKLSYNSIRSIVNALTEEIMLASGKTLTLSRKAVNNGFTYYIGEGYDPVLPEDPNNPYWQPLIAPKVSAGWTITLV